MQSVVRQYGGRRTEGVEISFILIKATIVMGREGGRFMITYLNQVQLYLLPAHHSPVRERERQAQRVDHLSSLLFSDGYHYSKETVGLDEHERISWSLLETLGPEGELVRAGEKSSNSREKQHCVITRLIYGFKASRSIE